MLCLTDSDHWMWTCHDQWLHLQIWRKARSFNLQPWCRPTRCVTNSNNWTMNSGLLQWWYRQISWIGQGWNVQPRHIPTMCWREVFRKIPGQEWCHVSGNNGHCNLVEKRSNWLSIFRVSPHNIGNILRILIVQGTLWSKVYELFKKMSASHPQSCICPHHVGGALCFEWLQVLILIGGYITIQRTAIGLGDLFFGFARYLPRRKSWKKVLPF